ncbi:MAG: LysR family transcriptional regulator [Paracoccus sp. (in: a-proteobacteria)]|nr:LysR family transcriptional regulator [Paracoccus sp. (in: a-proteobacteria)]
MRPTLRQLEYIVTVHRLGRFGLAADLLNVSQPSLSAQIAAVELDLGIRLFERSRGGVQTTSKGEEFVHRAQDILSRVEELRLSMSSDAPFSGRLRLGVLPSIGPYLLPQVVKDIHALHPDLRIMVREENTRDLELGLRAGRFDAIISTPEDHPNTRQERLFNESLWVAVALDDHLADNARPATADALRGRLLLTLDNSHRLSRIVYALAAQIGGMVSDDYEGTSLDSILLMAATGSGVAVIPELFARRQAIYREEVVVKPLQLDLANRDIALLFKAGDRIRNGPDLLAKALRSAAARLGLRVATDHSGGP